MSVTESPLVDPDVISRVLAKGRSTGADFAEIFVEDKRSTSAGLDDNKVEQVNSGRDRGAGIRVIAGETTGFAHTSDLSERGLLAAAEAAAQAARQGDGGVHKIALQPARPILPAVQHPHLMRRGRPCHRIAAPFATWPKATAAQPSKSMSSISFSAAGRAAATSLSATESTVKSPQLATSSDFGTPGLTGNSKFFSA